MNKQKKVLFVTGSKAASGYYRSELPCKILQEKGYTTDHIMYNTIDPINLIGMKVDDKGKEYAYDLTKSDVVIFQLVAYEALVLVIQELKKRGIFTIMDSDDAYTCLPRNNPAFLTFHSKTLLKKNADGKLQFNVFKEKCNYALDHMFKAMKTVDMLQVSTPELAKTYSMFNKNIVVLENCIDNELYNFKKPVNDKPVVIWSGTKTHIDDLYQLSGCVPTNCKLIIGGFTEAQKEGLFKDHPDVTFLKGVKLEDYPKEIVALGDIVAIPLVDNKFNACKSDLKGLEHAALGIPCVASDVAPYRRWVEHEINGFLVKKNRTKFWIRYLTELVNNKELREQMGAEAKKKAMERDIRKNIWRWEEVYFND